MLYDWGEPSLIPPPEPEEELCEACGEPLGERAYWIQGIKCCEACLRAEIEDMSPDELAEALGFEVEKRI